MKKGLLLLAFILAATPLLGGEVHTTWHPMPPGSHRSSFTAATTLVALPPEKIGTLLVEELDQWSGKIPRLDYSRIISKERAQAILQEASVRELSFDEVKKIIGSEEIPLEKRIYQKSSGKSLYYIVQYINYPWPAGNKWLLFQMNRSVDPGTQAVRIDFNRVAGQFPKIDGVWEVLPDKADPHLSRVTYSFVSDAGFQAPYFIAKTICMGQAKVVVETLRRHVESHLD